MFVAQRMRVGRLFNHHLQVMNKIWCNFGRWIDSQGDSLSNYLKEHSRLVALLPGVAIAAYGFELFNLNLTIDEELHAFASQDTMWIAQGRWGMFLLNRLLIPYPIVPFVPLFVALVFHVAAVLILLCAWGVESKRQEVAVGSIAVSFPTMAYLYTFNTLNYGIGIGLFLGALSLFLFTRLSQRRQLLAAIPGTLSISIYQGLFVALVCLYVVQFVCVELQSSKRSIDLRNLFKMVSILGLSAATYYMVQKLFLLTSASGIVYVDQFFDINFAREHFDVALKRTLSVARKVYMGSPAVYGSRITFLAPILVVSGIGVLAALRSSPLAAWNKLLIGLAALGVLLLPLTVGLLMRGEVAIRFLVAVPFVVAGFAMLGMRAYSKNVQMLIGVAAGICVFQFVQSTNYLFSSSHLALQADRALGAMLIARIEEAKDSADGGEPKYYEVIGYFQRAPTKLIPKSETFGASFFEWEQGNPYRIAGFLRTLGYEGLSPLPQERRIQFTALADSMPFWPRKGSIARVGDTVLIKFGNYSTIQRQSICEPVHVKEPFCAQ
jgi:Glucosyl transferase GtrII